MNRKMLKGIVLIVSLSLVCPLPTSAVKSQLPRHKSQVSPTSHKTGQLQEHHHHHQSAVASAASAAASSLQQNDAGGGHQHQQQLGSGVVKETPLVRLKRIKRQVTSLRTIQPSSMSSSSSNSKYAVDHLARNPEKMEMRPIGLMNDGRTPATPLGSFHDFGVGGGVGGRVHTEMLRRLEEADRKLSQHSGGGRGRGGGGGGKGRSSGGKGFSSKTNEIADLRKGHHNIKDGSRLHLTGTGTGTESYAHHKHEQDKLDNTAAVVAAVRQRYNRKNKHQKNRSDFSVKGTKVRNYALAPRLRPGDRIQDSEVAVVSGRGRGRGGHADEKGHLATEAKHRTRRGQRSGMVSTSSRNAGSQAEGVKTELERIRRMQRDLMKEISHLEHMKEKKKKKRRNVSERISQGQRKVAAPKRK